MNEEHNTSDTIIEQVTAKLRRKWQSKLDQAFTFGWNFEKPDQTEFDGIGRSAISDVLIEINVLDEAIARKCSELQRMADEVNHGLSQYFPMLTAKFEESDLDAHDDNDFTHKSWAEMRPRKSQ